MTKLKPDKEKEMPEVATPNQGEREFDTGLDEYFKSHSALIATNAKRTYDEFQDVSLASARRSQSHLDDLNARTLNGLEQLQTLQAKINEEHFASLHELRKHLANIQTDRQRHADIWAYEAAYDLGNPVTTGSGDALRAAAYTPNRSVDTASAGVAVSAEAVAAAVAKQVDATITPVLATLQQVIQALTTATSTIANVVNQAQPKTT